MCKRIEAGPGYYTQCRSNLAGRRLRKALPGDQSQDSALRHPARWVVWRWVGHQGGQCQWQAGGGRRLWTRGGTRRAWTVWPMAARPRGAWLVRSCAGAPLLIGCHLAYLGRASCVCGLAFAPLQSSLITISVVLERPRPSVCEQPPSSASHEGFALRHSAAARRLPARLRSLVSAHASGKVAAMTKRDGS